MFRRLCKQYCFLILELPRDNEQSPLVIEQVFSAIHGAKIQTSIEVWAKKGTIQFAIWCHKKNEELLKSIIENHYQGIVIRECEDFMPENCCFQELELDIADIFPIRRYSQVADYVKREHTDPWGELLAPLRKMSNGEVKGMQFIITPHFFHRKADHTLRIYKSTNNWWIFELFPWLQDDFIKLVYNSWLLRTFYLWASYGKKIDTEKIDHRKHDIESLAESAKSKIAQLSFKVTIRLIYSGKNLQKLNEIFSGFSQFNTKKFNAFKLIKTRKFIFKKSNRRRHGKVIHLCIEELAGILVLPTKQVKIAELQRTAFKVVQSSQMDAKSGILIGRTLADDKKLYLSCKDVKGHMAIVGRSGVGKSTIILQMVQDLIRRGKGLCVFDPHGDLIDSITAIIPQERIIHTMLIDSSDSEHPPAFNIFATHAPKDQILASINDSFKKIFSDGWGARTEQVLRNSLRLAICDPKANIMSVSKILSDSEYRKKLLAINDDSMIDMYWQSEFPTNKRLIDEHVSPLRNKLSQFLEAPALRNILGQSKNKIDFREAIQEQKIVLIKLAKGTLGESNATLLGNFFLHAITQAAFSESKKQHRKSFPIFVDEMQLFSGVSDGVFKNILEEGRKYGLHLRGAFQYLEQLKDLESSIFGNIKTLISFALNVDDSNKIAKYIEEIDSRDLINLPQYFGYIRLIQSGTPVFSSFKTIQPTLKEESYINIIRAFSRVKFSRKRAKVEREIKEYLRTELPIPS